MFQTLPPVSLLNVGLRAIPRHTENLVIILGLAPLESCLCFLQLTLQRLDITVRCRTLRLSFLDSRLEVSNGSVV